MVGRHDNWLTRALSAPGMWFQLFTTNEPDDSMIEVAIEALTLVLPEEKGQRPMVKKVRRALFGSAPCAACVGGRERFLLARELLGFASGKSAAALMADRELYASEQTAERMEQYTARALQGEPLAYILGKWSFYGLELTVTPDVLIPRDDTMAVTELAIESSVRWSRRSVCWISAPAPAASALPSRTQIETARVTLADLSQPALRIARKNIADLKMIGRVNASSGGRAGVCAEIWGQFDLIVSNPPYVTTQEMAKLDVSVWAYEPHLALWGGADWSGFLPGDLARISPRRCVPAAGSASNSGLPAAYAGARYAPVRRGLLQSALRQGQRRGSSARFARQKIKETNV